jgi:hypothetical protein
MGDTKTQETARDFTLRFWGRKRGAIGICYFITAVVFAESLESAKLSLYDDYEHIMKLR